MQKLAGAITLPEGGYVKKTTSEIGNPVQDWEIPGLYHAGQWASSVAAIRQAGLKPRDADDFARRQRDAVLGRDCPAGAYSKDLPGRVADGNLRCS
jgi:hypothetical protein